MPVDFGQIDAMAGAVADIYSEAELALLRLITDRLARDLDAPDWATRRLADLQALRRGAQAIAAQLQRDGEDAARSMVAAAYRTGDDWAVADLADAIAGEAISTHASSVRHGGAVQALADALVGELRPLHLLILPQAETAYRNAIAGAVGRHLTGAQSMRRSAQAAWTALVNKGITGFRSVDGRRWRLHTYVEMAVRTAATRAATEAMVDRMTAMGHRFVYVTDTPGECELCRPWEHAVLALWGSTGDVTASSSRTGRDIQVHVKATLDEARRAGLMHPQCRHSVRPWLPGITKLSRYTADPAGDAARQRQRAIERTLRHWREREAAAFEPIERARARAHINAWEAEMARHIEATGVPRLKYREFPGAGFEAPAHRRDDAVRLGT